jgi:flagellar FliL protein
MAEEKGETIEVIEEIGEEGVEKERKKRGLKFSIPPFIFYLPIIAGLGFLGYLGYKQFFGERTKKEEEVEVAKVVAKKGIIIPGPSLVVNLSDVNVPRFLKISMVFEVDRGIAVAEIQDKEPIIKDAIIGLLSSKTMADLRGYDSQQILKEEIISRVNSLLERGRVINIYFTDFIVQ